MYLLLLFTMMIIACAKEEDNSETGESLLDSPKFTFTQLKVNNVDVKKETLLKQIKGYENSGYTLKNIIVDDKEYAEVDQKRLSLKLKKGGIVKVKLIFTKEGYKPINIEGEIAYTKIISGLTFTALNTDKNLLTSKDILENVKESDAAKKIGFTVKSIKNISDLNIADIEGVAPDIAIRKKKMGRFKATIVLERKEYKDIELSGAEFGFLKKVNLKSTTVTFKKLVTYKKTISSEDLMDQIQGNTGGFTIKNISVTDNSFADVTGTGAYRKIEIKKLGSFKIVLVLEQKGYKDITLNGDITHTAETLVLNVFKTEKGLLTKNDIFAKITGKKIGYSIKNVAVVDPSYATVDPSTHSLRIKRHGQFDITITLQKTNTLDIVLNSKIEYRPRPTIKPSFDRFETTKKLVSSADINSRLKNRTGYTIKNIVVKNPSYATVTGRKPNFALNLLKKGRFIAVITLERPRYPDELVNANFEGVSENLRLNTIKTLAKTLSSSDIMANVIGNKAGYSVKGASLLNSSFATITTSPFLLTFRKAGTFLAYVTFEKTGHFDTKSSVLLEGLIRQITFDAVSLGYKNSFSTLEINNQLRGTYSKSYTLKSISNISDPSVAEVVGIKPNISLNIKKAGSFTATIEIEPASNPDIVLRGCSFTFSKLNAKGLYFARITRTYAAGLSLTTKDLIDNVRGAKTGYTLKSISTPSVPSVARVVGTKPNFSLNISSKGNFTCDIILEHDVFDDVAFTAEFRIVTLPTESFTFNKLTRIFNGSDHITSADLMSRIPEIEKAGWAIKDITLDSNASGVVIKDGTKPALFLRILKYTNSVVTVKLDLEKSGYVDSEIFGAEIELRKNTARTLSFQVYREKYTPFITNAEIERSIQGHAGYTIKSITGISDTTIAELSGGASVKGLKIKKAGVFTATLVVEHPKFLDATITGARFEVLKKGTGSNLFDFTTMNVHYKPVITESDLLANISRNSAGTAGEDAPDKTNFRIKEITGISSAAIAEVTGTPPVSLSIKKYGVFDATLTMEHPYYKDAVVQARFNILRGMAPVLTFTKLGGVEDYNNPIMPHDKILEGVSGDKAGYTIKSLTGISDTTIAEVTGINILKIKKTGTFTLNMVLEHKGKADVAITGAEFEIESYYITHVDPTSNNLTITAINPKRIDGLKDKKHLIFPEKINGIEVKYVGAYHAIGAYTLSGLSSFVDLQQISFPKTLIAIHQSAFKNLANLQRVNIPNSLLHIEDSAFKNCKNLHTLNINVSQSNLTAIRRKAFEGCDLTQLRIPLKVNFIGEAAFKNCSNLTDLQIPSSSTGLEIGKSAFEGGGITSFNNVNRITKIGELAFAGNSFRSVSLPSTVTTVGKQSFKDCNSLTSFTFSNLVDITGESMFEGCGNLDSVTLRNVTHVAKSTFENCIKLKSVQGSEIGHVLDKAFKNCVSLQYIYSQKTISIGRESFQNCIKLKLTYSQTSIVSIGARAFKGCNNLRNNSFDNLKNLGESAFEECQSLYRIRVPELRTVPNYAFRNCRGLQTFRVTYFGGVGVKHVGKEAFLNCTALNHMKVNSLVTVGERAFKNCTRAFASSSVWILRLKTAGESAFENCISIRGLSLGSKELKVIPKYMFKGCTGLQSVYCHTGLIEIKSYSFENCTSLVKFKTYGNLKILRKNIFKGANEKLVFYTKTPPNNESGATGSVISLYTTTFYIYGTYSQNWLSKNNKHATFKCLRIHKQKYLKGSYYKTKIQKIEPMTSGEEVY